tara:strand:- start:49 stop:471 length:423 start_codon:yes stop_codon:yes gene_type:complete
MVNSRTKGHNFERRIVSCINHYLKSVGSKDRVKRNLDQTQYKGQADIYWDNFAIECKRYAGTERSVYKQEWWNQVCVAAKDKYIPILIFKYDRRPIQTLVPIYLMTGKDKGNNEAVYLSTLESLCKDREKVLRYASEYNL